APTQWPTRHRSRRRRRPTPVHAPALTSLSVVRGPLAGPGRTRSSMAASRSPLRSWPRTVAGAWQPVKGLLGDVTSYKQALDQIGREEYAVLTMGDVRTMAALLTAAVRAAWPGDEEGPA